MTLQKTSSTSVEKLVFRLKHATGLIHLKRLLTRLDARIAYCPTDLKFEEKSFRTHRTFFSNEADQTWFDAEITPYFAALPAEKKYKHIIDAGASSGLFSIVSTLLWPQAQVHAFEPSKRQRLLLVRNLALNQITRVAVEPYGLWNEDTSLKFKSAGCISSVAGTEVLPDFVIYDEVIRARSLDSWAASQNIEHLDLIKMDIEGSEIEALLGAHDLLTTQRPVLMIQAYHIREGERTFERCTSYLETLGYRCGEIGTTGLLIASPRM